MYLAHHELESVIVMFIIIITCVKLHRHIYDLSTQSADDKLVMQSQSMLTPLCTFSLTCQVCEGPQGPLRHSGPEHVAAQPSIIKPQQATASASLSQAVTTNRLGSIPEPSASKGSGTITGQKSIKEARSFTCVSCLCIAFMPVARNILQ